MEFRERVAESHYIFARCVIGKMFIRHDRGIMSASNLFERKDNSLRTFERDRIELTPRDTIVCRDSILLRYMCALSYRDNNNRQICMAFEWTPRISLNSYHGAHLNSSPLYENDFLYRNNTRVTILSIATRNSALRDIAISLSMREASEI